MGQAAAWPAHLHACVLRDGVEVAPAQVGIMGDACEARSPGECQAVGDVLQAGRQDS